MPDGNVSVGTTATQLCESAPGRKNIRFQAPTANTASVYIDNNKQVRTSGVNRGLELPPGAIMTMNYLEDHDIQLSWYAIVASGTQNIIVKTFF